MLFLLSTHFKNVPTELSKCFLTALLSHNVYCNATVSLISVGQSKHEIFYFFGEMSLASVVRASCYFQPWFVSQIAYEQAQIWNTHAVGKVIRMRIGRSGKAHFSCILPAHSTCQLVLMASSLVLVFSNITLLTGYYR